VAFDGGRLDAELLGDQLVGGTTGEQAEHLGLPRTETGAAGDAPPGRADRAAINEVQDHIDDVA
jgi:hypothetical protein